MAITVKDIREKEFAKAKHGYDMNEVDDFLDEIAEQLTAVIQENLGLAQQVNALTEAVQAAQADQTAEPAPAPVAAPVIPAVEEQKEPAYDENSYFKNLEATLRETLISGQRIADETVSKAQREADDLLASAREEAAGIHSDALAAAEETTADAAKKVEAMEEKVEALKTTLSTFKSQIRAMIDAQEKLISEE